MSVAYYTSAVVSDIAIFVLKRDVKLQPTNQPTQVRGAYITAMELSSKAGYRPPDIWWSTQVRQSVIKQRQVLIGQSARLEFHDTRTHTKLALVAFRGCG